MLHWRKGLTDANSSQGLDLDKLAMKKRFMFIDGLSFLFLPPSSRTAPREDPSLIQGNDLARIASRIKSATQALKAQGRNVVLVIDQLDFLLASSNGQDGITSSTLAEMMMELRQVCGTLGDILGLGGREMKLIKLLGRIFYSTHPRSGYAFRHSTADASGSKSCIDSA